MNRILGILSVAVIAGAFAAPAFAGADYASQCGDQQGVSQPVPDSNSGAAAADVNDTKIPSNAGKDF